MKRLDFVRWLVAVLGFWLMLGSAEGREEERWEVLGVR